MRARCPRAQVRSCQTRGVLQLRCRLHGIMFPALIAPNNLNIPRKVKSLPFHLQWCVIKRQADMAVLPPDLRPPPTPAPLLPLPRQCDRYEIFRAFNSEASELFRAHQPVCPSCGNMYPADKVWRDCVVDNETLTDKKNWCPYGYFTFSFASKAV